MKIDDYVVTSILRYGKSYRRLALGQVVIFFNSLFKQVMRFSRSLPPKSTHVSSAYSTVNCNSDTLQMSLVNMI